MTRSAETQGEELIEQAPKDPPESGEPILMQLTGIMMVTAQVRDFDVAVTDS